MSSCSIWILTSNTILPKKYEVKKESEKVGLKLNIQKTNIMVSSPIISWQIDGKTVETVADSIFLDSKITADGDCSHEIKRHFLLGRKVMTNVVQFSSFQSLSLVLLFVTPGIAAHQASLSITSSQISNKLMSIEWVVPSSHLILFRPPTSALNPSQHQSLFQ